jgi:transposase
MPRARTSMRKIREVLRLKWERGLSHRQVERSLQMGRGTVGGYLRRAVGAGLSWEQVTALSDEELEGRLFPSEVDPPAGSRALPQWARLHQELKRKGVTLSLLWQEYRESEPEGYGYSRFCELYRSWEGQLEPCLRQDYEGGEKLFVDYAGQTVVVRDATTGESREAQVFVAVLGASSYTYAEATWSQGLADWIGSHVRTFAFVGGVSELVVPDNLKSGVTSPCRYEPDVNRTYTEMAEHYGVAVVPARVKKPRDKAKVESGVLQVSRWILARLRNETFFSLRELNDSIGKHLVELNERPLKVLGISRRELFERVDRPALRPLPPTPYEHAEWKDVRVAPDYHVELEGHYYSVPYQLLRQQLQLRATAQTVEVFHKGKRVAAHRRDRHKGRHTTLPEHMPKAHQAYLEWTPTRLVQWAEKTGSATAELVAAILRSRLHPQQGFRSCLGLMRLGDRYGGERLEAACQRALAIQGHSYKSVKSILDHGLDRQPVAEQPEGTPPIQHGNLRGAAYYRGGDPEEEIAPC